MTEPEHDLLRAVWGEAGGKPDEWRTLTELPVAALGLCRNGYLQLRPEGPQTWSVALTPQGAELARTLFR